MGRFILFLRPLHAEEGSLSLSKAPRPMRAQTFTHERSTDQRATVYRTNTTFCVSVVEPASIRTK